MIIFVPTPIGNKEDITLRALRHLQSSAVILAEDTRTCKSLLAMYDIEYKTKQFFSYTSYTTDTQLLGLIKKFGDQDIIVVSEAGTPGLSDPGKSIIRICCANQIAYTVLPGATALVPAIVSAGFATHVYTFLGFAPQKKGRETFFGRLSTFSHAVFFYESVHRIEKMLGTMKKLGLTGTVSIARELSKHFEQCVTDSVENIIQQRETNTIVHKGEFVIGYYPAGVKEEKEEKGD